ncbi:ESX secretion-associated protein EspG [Mycobacterium sp. PSTR-4-N]|uniref:ESX secretion-associated protein EspG n=1 Tax=Mycobacterium sp. PSTR-4-N TaxID=2917745 RepID=UPI001F14E245|nr:ESX secretion-associated protein EspG [Mycobacterium sp. PSTR-4-N]MCG7594745.1 ESX secretion-associated protein EspG [Mycobacterium sp. PSTR-4-N]
MTHTGRTPVDQPDTPEKDPLAMIPARSTEHVGDVTVNLHGMWMLQAMLDIATVAPELSAVPYGAPRESTWISGDPRIEQLQAAGVVGQDGHVITQVAARMRVLAAPDVEVAILIARGALSWKGRIDVNDPATWRRDIPDNQLQIVLARRDGRWVSAARAGDDITIDDVRFDGGSAAWLRDVLVEQLNAVHPVEASRIEPMNLPYEDIVSAAAQRADAGDDPQRELPLRALGIPPAALAELGALLDEPVVETVVYARVHTDARSNTSATALNIRDTDAGRVVLYQMLAPRGSTQDWMVIAPGSPGQILQGIQAVLSSVNARDWENHERFA